MTSLMIMIDAAFVDDDFDDNTMLLIDDDVDIIDVVHDRQWHLVDGKLLSLACVILGARGTNELGRTLPG